MILELRLSFIDFRVSGGLAILGLFWIEQSRWPRAMIFFSNFKIYAAHVRYLYFAVVQKCGGSAAWYGFFGK